MMALQVTYPAGGLTLETQATTNTLRPRLGRAVGVCTTPPALHPDQAGRTPEAGQIPDVDTDPVLGLGAGPAGRTPDEIDRRLDRDHDFGVGLLHHQDPEAVQSQQC